MSEPFIALELTDFDGHPALLHVFADRWYVLYNYEDREDTDAHNSDGSATYSSSRWWAFRPTDAITFGYNIKTFFAPLVEEARRQLRAQGLTKS